MTRSKKAEMWRRQVEGHGKSGLSIGAYCRQQELSEASFYYWRRKLELASSAAVEFIPVTIAPEVESGDAGIWVRLGSGVTLVLAKDFDEATLRRAVVALR